MNLFAKNEVNTSRQFEFDMAKAVCILGMVLVHCFEAMTVESEAGVSVAYYIMVSVLDCVFGAGTFMLCMGLGIAYSWKGNADLQIKRGVSIFLLGYLLNFIRDGIPMILLTLLGEETWSSSIVITLCTDIMPFAGLALLLFGLLKKLKLSDGAVFAVALGMSVLGSFLRFFDFGNPILNSIAGLFIGTVDPDMEDGMACFPLLNWFIIVVIGYLYGNLLRRCTDKKKYYAVAFPVSALLLAVYFALSIPGRFGMMSGDLRFYYHFSTPNAVILFLGAVFATGLYYFLSSLLSEKVKTVITRISSHINTIYCIHWLIICWLDYVLEWFDFTNFSDGALFLVGILIFTVSVLLAEMRTRSKEKKRNVATQ